MLEKLFGKNFGADMAQNMIGDLLQKLETEDGTRSVVITLDKEKNPVIIKYKFDIPSKFKEAQSLIKILEDQLKEAKDLIAERIDLNKKDKENGK